MRRIVAILLLGIVLVGTLPFAAAHLWRTLEEGAYRSPFVSSRELLTPREERLLELAELAALGATQDDSAVSQQPAVDVAKAHAGAALFEANGCYACHSLDGETKIGPTLYGILGEPVEFDDGSSLVIDEAYLIESILQPDARKVAGYDESAMPSYEGLVTPDDAKILADYIMSLQ